jgi:hypothetical protein
MAAPKHWHHCHWETTHAPDPVLLLLYVCKHTTTGCHVELPTIEERRTGVRAEFTAETPSALVAKPTQTLQLWPSRMPAAVTNLTSVDRATWRPLCSPGTGDLHCPNQSPTAALGESIPQPTQPRKAGSGDCFQKHRSQCKLYIIKKGKQKGHHIFIHNGILCSHEEGWNVIIRW